MILKINKMNEFKEWHYRPQFSLDDIKTALSYASKYVTIDPAEVGKQVYDVLFAEKVNEYLDSFE